MEAKRQEVASVVQARNDNGNRRKLAVRVRRLDRSETFRDRTDGTRCVGGGGGRVKMNASFLTW